LEKHHKTSGSELAIGDAVVVNPGYAVCLMYRVIRFCCRFAPDRGQARSYKVMRRRRVSRQATNLWE